MSKLRPIFITIFVLVSASFACQNGAPKIPTPDPNFIGTTIAQTVVAAMTQTVQPLIPLTGASPTATYTPKPTLTPTIVITTTPLTPQITVSVATNCRVGPGKVYDRAGGLMVGEVAEILGVDPTWNYWYIRNPDLNPEFCWVWGKYATVSGNTLGIPIFTPMPTATPAPAFEASYNGLHKCTDWWIDIKLQNNGGIAFKSVSLTLTDTTKNITLSLSADTFKTNNGCSGSNTSDGFEPNATQIISAPNFNYDPTGHKLNATITLCSNKGINGTCTSKTITFTP